MLTEPVGPRSPDEVLAAVYRRTDQARRRRRQQLAAGMAAVTLGLGGLVSLQSGEEDASRLRVTDRNETKEVSEESASATPTTAAATAEESEGTTATTTAAAPASSDSRPPHDDADGPAPTTPPLPTTSTTLGPIDNGPDIRVLAETADAAGDSTMSAWYWDIVHGSMHLDLYADVVVFTTNYRTPTESGDRETRVLRTSFDVDRNPVTVQVTETGNSLGTVELDGRECTECTRSFDEVEGELMIVVPVERMNEHLEDLYDAGTTIEDEVGGLHVTTGATELDPVWVDEAGGGA